MTYSVIFQNKNFIAVDKPSGWLSVPSRTGAADPRPCLGHKLEEELAAKVFPVHRLDFEVSGMILFALNADAHREACKIFESRGSKKTYQAWTERAAEPSETKAPQKEERWESLLVRGKKRSFEAEYGKRAVTVAQQKRSMKTRWGDVLTWELEPLTGRAHQLRFELSKRHFPILGDQLYGAKLPFVECAIALRSVKLDTFGAENLRSMGLPEILEAKSLEEWSKSL